MAVRSFLQCDYYADDVLNSVSWGYNGKYIDK
jgi:hypothetical protein